MKRHLKFLIIFVLQAASLSFGGQDRGGAQPHLIDEAALKLLIEGNGLKKAMLNYLKTLSLEKMDVSTEEGKAVHLSFTQMLRDGALQKDIQTKKNYRIGNTCLDAYSKFVPASTKIGDRGGEICFDTAKLYQEYKNLSSEQVMIRLASLAFHEHVHHFQKILDGPRANEKQAYLVAAYVKITAKTTQTPVLEWFAAPFVVIDSYTSNERPLVAKACSLEVLSGSIKGQSDEYYFTPTYFGPSKTFPLQKISNTQFTGHHNRFLISVTMAPGLSEEFIELGWVPAFLVEVSDEDGNVVKSAFGAIYKGYNEGEYSASNHGSFENICHDDDCKTQWRLLVKNNEVEFYNRQTETAELLTVECLLQKIK